MFVSSPTTFQPKMMGKCWKKFNHQYRLILKTVSHFPQSQNFKKLAGTSGSDTGWFRCSGGSKRMFSTTCSIQNPKKWFGDFLLTFEKNRKKDFFDSKSAFVSEGGLHQKKVFFKSQQKPTKHVFWILDKTSCWKHLFGPSETSDSPCNAPRSPNYFFWNFDFLRKCEKKKIEISLYWWLKFPSFSHYLWLKSCG